MDYRERAKRQNRLAHASKRLTENWFEAEALVRDLGASLDELRNAAIIERYRFARRTYENCARHLAMRPPPYRDVISRAYYAMYHAARAAILAKEGFDVDEHEKVPSQLPSELATKYENVLKEARLLRNRADYDPYPSRMRYWKNDAHEIRAQAFEMLADVRAFLTSLGHHV